MAVFFVLDRLLKFIAINSASAKSIPIIGKLLSFKFIPNYFIALSIPVSGIWLNYLISILLLCILIYIIKLTKIKKTDLELFLWISIFLGAVSNLYDRIKYGFVIDYLDIRYFSVLNIADLIISLSIVYLIFYLIKNSKKTL